ncbi:MAG: DUF2804 domain-containing protein [Erysipelotrichales bacterium]|nr:DUF2804 domain-containing protein [Erysipelotrichales bacterium]
MQIEVVKPGKLLDKKGELIETGYARSLIKEYDRKDIKAAGFRIKEWDYYLVSDGKCALALTIADNSYMGMYSVSVLDLVRGSEVTKSVMTAAPFGKTKLPSTSKTGDVKFEGNGLRLAFLNNGKERRLSVHFENFKDGNTLEGEVVLNDEPEDSMVIITPYKEDKKAFYYNQKINCMRASGKVSVGSFSHEFVPDTAFGTLDWGRGVWTYSNTWYWGSASYVLNGHKFGWNIGYGFGNTEAASENMLFYDGKAHKLDRVTFQIPVDENGKDDYLSPWRFTSNDGRFECDFKPVIDRASRTNAGIIESDQHQVFGNFTGYAVLDDGTKLEFENFPGFAEKVKNRW